MDSGNKFFNAYIDIAVATIQEQTVQSLQLKAQAKITNELLSEKDQFIDQLSKELEQHKQNAIDIVGVSDKAKYWEDSYHAVQNKLSHMETLTRQLADMKNDIIRKNEELINLENDKNEQIKSLEAQIADLKKKQQQKAKEIKEPAITKVDLNNKVGDTKTIAEEKKKNPTDDF